MSIKLSFEKTIYSKMLKLSVAAAVHSSLTEILICQFCTHDSRRCKGNRKFHVALANF